VTTTGKGVEGYIVATRHGPGYRLFWVGHGAAVCHSDLACYIDRVVEKCEYPAALIGT
jgi:hypothetical protein